MEIITINFKLYAEFFNIFWKSCMQKNASTRTRSINLPTNKRNDKKCPLNYQKIKTTIETCWLPALKLFNDLIKILLNFYCSHVIWGIFIHHNKLENGHQFFLETNHNNFKGCYNPLFVNLLSERCNSVYMKKMKVDINIIRGVHHSWCYHLQWNIKILHFKFCMCSHKK